MNTTAVREIGTRLFGRAMLLGQKHAPVTLTVVGIAGFIGTVVLASRATLEAKPIVVDAKADAFVTNRHREAGLIDDREHAKELTRIYGRAALRLGKVYGPAVALGVGSTVSVASAHGMMQKRNTALTAAYVGMERAYKEYRKRVVDKYGEDEERELRQGEVVEREVVDAKTGETKKVWRSAADDFSPYARFFDELCPNWSRNPEYNLLFLRGQQAYLNDLLRTRGHVFLNEVYDALGMEHTKAGALVGWLRNGDGDGYISFGIYDPTPKHKEFINGREPSILLDFNVDGVIYDRI